MPAEPVTEGHVGTARVVGLQDLPHDQEGVQQPPGPKGPVQRNLRFPEAERVSPQMRVTDFVIGGRGDRFLRNHPQFLIVTEPGPVPDDLEGTEVDLFQDDPLGDHRHGCLGPIHVNRRKLGHQRQYVPIDVSCGGDGLSGLRSRLGHKLLQIGDEPLTAGVQRLLKASDRRAPAVLPGLFGLALQPQEVVQMPQRETRHRRFSGGRLQRGHDPFSTVP